jgi:hypothetical protein
MGPIAHADGHDRPGSIDELIPSFAAVVDDVVVGCEDAVDSQLSRMNCPTFSTGLISGERGGNRTMVMLSGTSSLARAMPTGLIHEEDSVSTLRHGLRDLGEMQSHGRAVTERVGQVLRPFPLWDRWRRRDRSMTYVGRSARWGGFHA